MTVPATNEDEPVAVEDAENPMPHETIKTVEEVPVEKVLDPYQIEVESKTNWSIFVGLVLSLVCYTLVQIHLVKWNFANIFVGIVAITIYLCFGCYASRSIFQRYLLLATNFSAVYSGVVAGLLFFFRIEI
jgi:hypothetical protein